MSSIAGRLSGVLNFALPYGTPKCRHSPIPTPCKRANHLQAADIVALFLRVLTPRTPDFRPLPRQKSNDFNGAN
jgi:hypothetical protein